MGFSVSLGNKLVRVSSLLKEILCRDTKKASVWRTTLGEKQRDSFTVCLLSGRGLAELDGAVISEDHVETVYQAGNNDTPAHLAGRKSLRNQLQDVPLVNSRRFRCVPAGWTHTV